MIQKNINERIKPVLRLAGSKYRKLGIYIMNKQY